MQSPKWFEKRAAALAFHGPACDTCGASEYLHVHHLNYKRLGAELMSDLQVLCRPCHELVHEDKRATECVELTKEFMAIVK